MLGGLPITVASRQQVARFFVDHALENRGRGACPFYSTSANGQVLSMCSQDTDTLSEFLAADEILADGMPMVIYSQLVKGHSLPERVATTDLFHDVAKLAEDCDASFYMLGADEETNECATRKVRESYPGLVIAGRRNGYFSKEEEGRIVEQINAAEPDILWVSMGAPLEQEFIHRHINNLPNVGVIKTSGGLFDFLSGKHSRAPGWIQTLGFEWAYRAMLEPKRLGPRYILTNPHALGLLFTRSQ